MGQLACINRCNLRQILLLGCTGIVLKGAFPRRTIHCFSLELFYVDIALRVETFDKVVVMQLAYVAALQ